MCTYRVGYVWTILLALAFSGGVAQADSVLPATGLVAWWKADGDATEAINSRNGTAVDGAGFGSGIHDQAFNLGSNGYFTVADNDDWTFTGDFTISLWAKWSQLDSGGLGNPEDVFIAHDEGGGSTKKWGFFKGGGLLNFHINNPGISSVFLAQTPFAPTVDQWYHLAVRRNGNLFSIFVDGTESINSQNFAGSIPNAAVALMLGRGEGFRFNGGSLDEVAIYHRSLSSSEIAAIVPEPATMLIILLGAPALARCARRRRQV